MLCIRSWDIFLTKCKTRSTVYFLQVSWCRHGVGYQISDLLTVAMTCVYFGRPPPRLGKGTCWTISTAAAPLPSEYSRKHLLRAEPGSSLAAVVYCQCILVACIQPHTRLSQSCLVTHCVNVNSGWSASWLVPGIHSPFRPQSDSAWCWPIVGGLIATFFIHWRLSRYCVQFHEKQIDALVVRGGL